MFAKKCRRVAGSQRLNVSLSERVTGRTGGRRGMGITSVQRKKDYTKTLSTDVLLNHRGSISNITFPVDRLQLRVLRFDELPFGRACLIISNNQSESVTAQAFKDEI